MFLSCSVRFFLFFFVWPASAQIVGEDLIQSSVANVLGVSASQQVPWVASDAVGAVVAVRCMLLSVLKLCSTSANLLARIFSVGHLPKVLPAYLHGILCSRKPSLRPTMSCLLLSRAARSERSPNLTHKVRCGRSRACLAVRCLGLLRHLLALRRCLTKRGIRVRG